MPTNLSPPFIPNCHPPSPHTLIVHCFRKTVFEALDSATGATGCQYFETTALFPNCLLKPTLTQPGNSLARCRPPTGHGGAAAEISETNESCLNHAMTFQKKERPPSPAPIYSSKHRLHAANPNLHYCEQVIVPGSNRHLGLFHASGRAQPKPPDMRKPT